ncbi:MAG TPA: NADPH-dependent glutamate synthase [Acidimicrobiales bacterium]
MLRSTMYRIVRRDELSPLTFSWEVEAPDVARAARPGHFVIVHVHEGAERIPLTIADTDVDAGTVTLVVQALGKSTLEMRDRYRTGDAIADLVGPLGQPQRIEKVGHVLLVGGGLGVAPMFPQLRAFAEAGNRTTAVAGFRHRDLVFWEERLAEHADRLVVCTDDGSYGRPGLVTEALAELVASDRPDLVVTIGPLVMMRACAEVTRPHGVRTMASLNTIMVDGTGMCGSCRCTVGGEVRFACTDGPDFDAHLVDFDELMARQRRFGRSEHDASDDYEKVCQLERTLFVEGKRGYKKLRELAPAQTPMPQRSAATRVRGFDEVNIGYHLTDALAEAERCIQCARPTCIAGCPVAVDIPRFIRHLLVHDLDGALGVIHESNILPSVCGRVCPQETQCEAQCVIARRMEPVAIGRLERFVGDHAHAAPPEVAPPTGRSVAVVGSGPAGLACAADLAKRGVAVTVFEALHVVGGVLRYGIPAFRLPRAVIDSEVDRLRQMGVAFETNKVVGKTFTVDQLLTERGFDAVFLGVGAGAPSFLNIPGETAGRVFSANELLTRVNLMGGDDFGFHDTPDGVGRSVAVVGAGNTAMDCLRVARRLGAPTVRCVYRRSRAEAPARVEEVRHAEEEGIEFLWLHNPVAVLLDEGGEVRGLRLERMELGEPDDRGRRSPVGTGEHTEIECDTVVVALGTKANPIITRSTPGLDLDKRGYVVADATTQATSRPGVFAGGDIVTGGATVILAMGAGRRAAAAIGDWLAGDMSWPPTEEVAPAEGALCPRCQQPLDDDADELCCAGESLVWRCDGCGKVSEGFAFPYGQCPACGGRLVRGGPAPVAGDAAVEAVRTALEIELGGRAFYERAAKQAVDPALRELFARFAAMEGEHLNTLERRYHLGGVDGSGAFTVDRAAIYAGVENNPEDPANLFRLAIAFEERAARHFAERGNSSDDEGVRELYAELAAEEREHVDLLTTELARWRADKAGLL